MDELHHHGRQLLFLLAVVFALLNCLHALQQLLDFRQTLLWGKFAVIHLVDDVHELLQEIHLVRVGGPKLEGVYAFAELDDRRGVPGGVLQQLPQPRSLQAEADAQDQVGVGNPGDVPCSGLVGMRVRPDGQQTEHMHILAGHVAHPVRHDVGGGDHA